MQDNPQTMEGMPEGMPPEAGGAEGMPPPEAPPTEAAKEAPAEAPLHDFGINMAPVHETNGFFAAS